jgi:hypothetical protein
MINFKYTSRLIFKNALRLINRLKTNKIQTK